MSFVTPPQQQLSIHEVPLNQRPAQGIQDVCIETERLMILMHRKSLIVFGGTLWLSTITIPPIHTLHMAEHNAPAETIKEKVDGQHWTTVRELWMRKDKEQCESWKDEVQNVLIFSGLFSAIVTAFLIESHKALRQDPAEETVQLLRQIAAQSTRQNSVTGNEPRIISICVNIFWFLSLVLSLTAALIGIVSLQWIRTHLRTLSNGSESLGLSHMHSLGLDNSYIPLIFTSLPVILILGLTFFFVGLIVFLFDLSWPVAIPAAIAIGFTYVFLITTTLHPALQSSPGKNPSDTPNCFPSPYRSPQSLLFLPGGDWRSRSQIWLQQRQEDFGVEKRQLSHLVSRPDGLETVFAYDTIKALVSVKESKSAESEKERTALAECLAEVLPIHLDLFPTGELADLIPFLPPSDYVPSALFSREVSVTREDLDAVALVQIATCKGRPSQTPALVKACVLTTRWLFERPHKFDSVRIPNNQPLHLISEPGKISHDVFEMLISTLTRFFSFAVHFDPEIEDINKTTHTSPYTYWFLVLSADILIKCSLSSEARARHAYLLAVTAARLDEGKACDYLVLTAAIYASVISKSSEMYSSSFGGEFLRAVSRHRDRFTGKMSEKQSKLHKAVKANEIAWVDIDRALEALRHSDTAIVTSSAGANDTMAGRQPLSSAYDRDPTLDEGRESSRDLEMQGGTLVHGEGSSQHTSEEVNSSGSGRNLDGESHQGKLDIVIDPRTST